MEAPVKRNVFLDLLFGGPPTSDELARRQADRTPRWVQNVKLCLYALPPVLWVASVSGVTRQVPVVGLWLSREWSLVAMVALATIIALDWYYKRRSRLDF